MRVSGPLFHLSLVTSLFLPHFLRLLSLTMSSTAGNADVRMGARPCVCIRAWINVAHTDVESADNGRRDTWFARRVIYAVTWLSLCTFVFLPRAWTNPRLRSRRCTSSIGLEFISASLIAATRKLLWLWLMQRKFTLNLLLMRLNWFVIGELILTITINDGIQIAVKLCISKSWLRWEILCILARRLRVYKIM